MSLRVYLIVEENVPADARPLVPVREGGRTVLISVEEWYARYPDREPVTVMPVENSHTVYSGNITHNLGPMAREARIYQHLWRPEELGITKASELIALLRAGLELLKQEHERFRAFNPSNGWGSYETLLGFVAEYLDACEQWPEAAVYVSR